MWIAKKLKKLMKLPQVEWTIREKKVKEYLKSRCPKLTEDEVWNLYLINKNTPLICSHMDTVWSIEAQKLLNKVRIVKPWMLLGRKNTEWIQLINNQLDSVMIGDDNIWADDKCWIAIAMGLYEELWDKISLLFTVWEETGWRWISHFTDVYKALLDDIAYAIIPDRKWASDIIWEDNDYCTKQFQDKIYELTKDFWYKPAMWVRSDCDTLSDYINCVNISCGYYNYHTPQEYVNIGEFENAYEAIKNIVINFNEKLEKPNKEYTRSWYSMYWWVQDYSRENYWAYEDDAIIVNWDTLYVSKEVRLWRANWATITLQAWEYYIDWENYM